MITASRGRSKVPGLYLPLFPAQQTDEERRPGDEQGHQDAEKKEHDGEHPLGQVQPPNQSGSRRVLIHRRFIPESSGAGYGGPMVTPDFDVLYEAMARRSPEFDGAFYTAVRTTGIFCRPICPARTPLAKNVSFFASPEEAIAAGYRACKRCKPTG